MPATVEPEFARARLAALLRRLAEIDDDREGWRVAYPLREAPRPITRATIGGRDDFEMIVTWG